MSCMTAAGLQPKNLTVSHFIHKVSKADLSGNGDVTKYKRSAGARTHVTIQMDACPIRPPAE